MVLMVLETEALSDAALPVAQLAAQMRLPEGYDADPGRDARLQGRLRAAVVSLERRLGKILLSREVVLSGVASGRDRLPLPVAPIQSLVSVNEFRDGVPSAVLGGRVDEDYQTPVLILPQCTSLGARLEVTVLAGWGDWSAVPDALAQAVLLLAETLDTGEDPAAVQVIERLIAPWRVRRIRGSL